VQTKVILYDELDPSRIPNFEKMKRALEAGDFRSADVKKVGPTSTVPGSTAATGCCSRSTGTRGRRTCWRSSTSPTTPTTSRASCAAAWTVDERQAADLPTPSGRRPSRSLPQPAAPTFHVLNKVISFDDAQQAVYTTPPPFVVIGSAGSGKTALTLEKAEAGSAARSCT
jgi:hypothetical protein